MRTYQESCLWAISCLLTLLFHHGVFSLDIHRLQLSDNEYTGDEGTDVKVDCHAYVTVKPRTLKWISSHNQQEFTQSKSKNGTSVTLFISSLHRYDAGTYSCLLVTADGVEEKSEVQIFVRPRIRATQTCRTTQFKCKVTKHCIFLKYRCDGKDDCGDGSDEECQGDPCVNKFICNNTRCVDRHFLCDYVDNCGDNSDERACRGYRYKGDKILSTTADPHNSTGGDDDDDNYSWVKSTIYTIIASTIGLVILISIGVILVFRAKMKRIRQRRMVRVLNAMQSYGGPEEPRMPPMTGEGCVEEEPFLPRTSQRYHQGPSIIFNVNNGVQYMPRYRYFIENPPPYSEVQGSGGSNGGEGEREGGRPCGNGDPVDNTPPPYSTIDRSSDAGPGGVNNNNNHNLLLNNQRLQQQRNRSSPTSHGESNLPGRLSGLTGHSNLRDAAPSSSSSMPHARACEWGHRAGSESCTGCVHCVPSSSVPLTTGTDLHVDDRARGGSDRLNHLQSLSQGQGPVVAVERRQQRVSEHHQDVQLSEGATLPPPLNSGGALGELRGVDINSHFLRNLLTVSSSSSSHNDSQRLTASVDSESSGRSGGSSSSSCSDDSVGSCALLGIAGASNNNNNGRDSIHETQTLKTRERDPPCLSHQGNNDVEGQLTENWGLRVERDSSLGLESQSHRGAYCESDVANRANATTSNNIVNDGVSLSSLPSSNSGEAVVPENFAMENNENGHLLSNQNGDDASLESFIIHENVENDIDILLPAAIAAAQNDYSSDIGTSTSSTDFPQRDSNSVSSGQTSNQFATSGAAAPENMDASSAVLQEVVNLDRNNRHKAKQGHLSVHKGQIVLHTCDGILAGQSIIPIMPTPPPALSPSSTAGNSITSGGGTAPALPPPHLSGEIIVKDGNIMLQIPVGRSLMPTGHVGFPCMENITQHQPPSPSSLSPSSSSQIMNLCLNPSDDLDVSAGPTNNPDKLTTVSSSSLPAANNNDTIPSSQQSHHTAVSTGTAAPSSSKPGGSGGQEIVSGGDLNIRNGQLVLEPPKPKTPSSQILSQLQGAECLSSSLSGEQEEDDGMPIGPVVNDKRHRPVTGSTSGHHRHHPSSGSKLCNSDIVLPRGKN